MRKVLEVCDFCGEPPSGEEWVCLWSCGCYICTRHTQTHGVTNPGTCPKCLKVACTLYK